MVSLPGDSWNTLEAELIYLRTKLNDLGSTLLGGKIIYSGLEDSNV
jgi:hypothetical protein